LAASEGAPRSNRADDVPERRRPGLDSFERLAGGRFLMGTEDSDQNLGDREGPVRAVEVEPFRMGVTAVTNKQFARFVEETGYRTQAEEIGWSFVFFVLLHPQARPYVLHGEVTGASWWLGVGGASWHRPDGPGSTIEGREEHPVVHVSWLDAQAYCEWAGVRLSTEVEWEYAARGGLEQKRYPWGDELTLRGQHRCNIWQGTFPTHNTREDGWLGTAPAKSFAPNAFGLYNTVGNVWEWCQDPWDASPSPPQGQEMRVIRGGSYLCHASYCNRYRVAARSKNSIDSSTGNTGFRVAWDLA